VCSCVEWPRRIRAARPGRGRGRRGSPRASARSHCPHCPHCPRDARCSGDAQCSRIVGS
jgi:hypothetical protein